MGAAPARPDVPVFFVARDLHGDRVMLRKGTLWEVQDRKSIRMWSESFGVPDDGRDWDQLDFVTTIVAPFSGFGSVRNRRKYGERRGWGVR